MNRKTKLLLFLALIASAMTLVTCKPIAYYLAQVYKVHGQVTVEGSSPPEPIDSVEVFVGEWQYSELTNYNGDYEMEMAAGTWTINFVKDGYLPKSVTGVTVGPDNSRYTLNVMLTPVQPEELLTVTGTITIEGGLLSNPGGTNETILVGIDTNLVDLVTLDIPNIDHQVASPLADGTTTYHYSISGVAPGTYYLASAIDVDGSGTVNDGDYALIYGQLNPGDPTNPADDPPANVVIDAAHTVFDFELHKLASLSIFDTWSIGELTVDGHTTRNITITLNSNGTLSETFDGGSIGNSLSGEFSPATLPLLTVITFTMTKGSGGDIPPLPLTVLAMFDKLTSDTVDFYADNEGNGFEGPFKLKRT